MEFTNVQIIELFHVAFLDALQRKLDRSRWVLKGGANLRYFIDSPRYSEDIDLDICGEEPWGMGEKVTGVLNGRLLETLLRVAGIEVEEVHESKQAKVTRRWKVGIRVPGHESLVRTKIEFSNRGFDERHRLEAVPERIVAPYALRAPLVQHYTDAVAGEQKVEALAGRQQTQARDVFDLDLLLRRRPLDKGKLKADLLLKAGEIAMEIPFDAFEEQVLRFLEPEVRDYYDDEESWVRMQTFVAGKLEEAI